MRLLVRRLRNGSTTAATLTLTDQDGNNISLASGTLSCLLTPTSGASLLTSGLLTASASGIGTITISAGTLSNMSGLNASGLVPFDLHCEARFATAAGTPYREEFTVPIHPRDGEWVYGLTTLGYARDYRGLGESVANDAQLVKAIRGMSQRIRRMCGRNKTTGFQSASYTEEFDSPVAGELPLTETPVTAISSVTIRHAGSVTRTLASTEYEITSDGKSLRLFGSIGAFWHSGGSFNRGFGHPSTRLSHGITRFPQRALRVTYTGGDTVVPPDLEDICLQGIAQRWAMQERDRGLASETIGNYTWTARTDQELDDWLEDLLAKGGWIGARAMVSG